MATSSQDTSKASSDGASGSNDVSVLAGETYDKLTSGEDHGDVSDTHKIASCIPNEAREAASDPEERLLQAIRDRRSEVDLGSYLNSTFEQIGETEELGVSPGLDRRLSVYDKALGAAEEGSTTEAFLLRTLDEQLATCLREEKSCRKISCWAARYNMVNVAMALVRRNIALVAEKPDPLPEEVLAIAVEYGHVHLVERLTKLQPGVDVNRGRSDFAGADRWTNAGAGAVPQRLTDASHLDGYERHGFKFLVPICSAARMGNVEMVKTLSECDQITDLEWALHWAAIMGHHHVVEELLNSEKEVDVNTLKQEILDDAQDRSSFGDEFNPLHLASIYGHASVVEALCADRQYRLQVNIESRPAGVTAVQMAAEMGHVEIVKILLERSEVEIAWALHGAAKKGHHDVVKELLNSKKEVDVNTLKQEKLDDVQDRSSFGDEFNPLHLASIYGHASVVQALCADRQNRLQVNIESRPAGVTALHMAMRKGHVETAKVLLERPEVDTRRTLYEAVKQAHHDVVRKLLESGKEMMVNVVERVILGDPQDRLSFGEEFNPLHLASLYGHVRVVEVLCGNKRLRANTESGAGMTALQIARRKGDAEIEKILLDRTEVQRHLDRLYRDRQDHVDAANAILVGATLIASVTFAAWLQPPLGYSEFYGSTSIDVGAPLPSGMHPSFVSVAGHPILDIFWIFNSMSFLFAIATLTVGASAARPPKQDKDIGEVVRTLRKLHALAYSLLTASIACVLGAFASAGFVVLPPVRRYTVTMGATLGIGLLVVLISTWASSWIISSWISSKVLYVLRIIKEFFATILDRLAPYFYHKNDIPNTEQMLDD